MLHRQSLNEVDSVTQSPLTGVGFELDRESLPCPKGEVPLLRVRLNFKHIRRYAATGYQCMFKVSNSSRWLAVEPLRTAIPLFVLRLALEAALGRVATL